MANIAGMRNAWISAEESESIESYDDSLATWCEEGAPKRGT